jgi:hypothetical protein
MNANWCLKISSTSITAAGSSISQTDIPWILLIVLWQFKAFASLCQLAPLLRGCVGIIGSETKQSKNN